MEKNTPSHLSYRPFNNKITTTDEYIDYILSKFHYNSHNILRMRKYISFTLMGYLDCLLLTNRITINQHKEYLCKIDCYVKYIT